MTALPTFITPLNPAAASWAGEVHVVARRLDTPLMPWQSDAVSLIGELRDPTEAEVDQWGDLVLGGVPRRKTIIVSVPRQSGKTTVAKATTTARAERADSQNLYGTAQTRVDAVSHLETLALDLGDSVKARLGVGAERITWPNGSIYRVIAPTVAGGHGPSIDWMLIDEAWTLDRHLLGGVRPAMSARPLSQMLVISTMGTVDSDVWNQLVTLGRESVNDPDSTVAYIEYSAPSEDAVFNPDRWPEWMPALGLTVSREHILSDMELMDPSEFVRAYGNLTVKTLQIVFPAEWVEKAWAVVQPPERLVLAVDVNDEPPGASVASGHISEDGRGVGRIIEWRYGSARWVPQVVAQIIEKRNVDAVVGDFGGPAREVRAELTAICEAAYVPLVDRAPRDVASDTGRFYDALREQKLALEKSVPLEEAISAAQRKELGDLWLVSRRKMTTDASPLISTILAHGAAVELALSPRVESFVI